MPQSQKFIHRTCVGPVEIDAERGRLLNEVRKAKTRGELILVINNGSTSTKLAVYDGPSPLLSHAIQVSDEDAARFAGVMDQREFRRGLIEGFLSEYGLVSEDFAIVASQEGALPPIKSGAYLINDLMVDVLERFPTFEHAANLGCVMAYDIAQEAEIPAIVYDGNTTDEFDPIAKVTGIDGVLRIPTSHVLNTKAQARKVAAELGKPYEECDFVCAHIGGGVSVSAHRHGLVVDDLFDDEGPMAPQRAGRIPACQLIDLCFSGERTRDQMQRLIRGKGGLVSLLGTQDALEVERRIAEGDEKAETAYRAMAMQIAKGIGELATVFSQGRLDRIVLTGGLAHSELLTGWIRQRVEWIAPVEVVPGENEMEALALGAYRVLTGQEDARVYDIYPANYVPKEWK